MMSVDPLWECGKSELIDMIHELRDAAEFEANVARWLAMNHTELIEITIPRGKDINVFYIFAQFLKAARLAVEEEE